MWMSSATDAIYAGMRNSTGIMMMPQPTPVAALRVPTIAPNTRRPAHIQSKTLSFFKIYVYIQLVMMIVVCFTRSATISGSVSFSGDFVIRNLSKNPVNLSYFIDIFTIV